MKRRLAALALALPIALGLSACGGGGGSWDAVEKDFISGCEQGGGNELPGYCQCVFDGLKSNYTPAQVEKMIGDGSQMPDELVPLITDCLSKLG